MKLLAKKKLNFKLMVQIKKSWNYESYYLLLILFVKILTFGWWTLNLFNVCTFMFLDIFYVFYLLCSMLLLSVSLSLSLYLSVSFWNWCCVLLFHFSGFFNSQLYFLLYLFLIINPIALSVSLSVCRYIFVFTI